jgi:hypothetical protein
MNIQSHTTVKRGMKFGPWMLLSTGHACSHPTSEELRSLANLLSAGLLCCRIQAELL